MFSTGGYEKDSVVINEVKEGMLQLCLYSELTLMREHFTIELCWITQLTVVHLV